MQPLTIEACAIFSRRVDSPVTVETRRPRLPDYKVNTSEMPASAIGIAAAVRCAAALRCEAVHLSQDDAGGQQPPGPRLLLYLHPSVRPRPDDGRSFPTEECVRAELDAAAAPNVHCVFVAVSPAPCLCAAASPVVLDVTSAVADAASVELLFGQLEVLAATTGLPRTACVESVALGFRSSQWRVEGATMQRAFGTTGFASAPRTSAGASCVCAINGTLAPPSLTEAAAGVGAANAGAGSPPLLERPAAALGTAIAPRSAGSSNVVTVNLVFAEAGCVVDAPADKAMRLAFGTALRAAWATSQAVAPSLEGLSALVATRHLERTCLAWNAVLAAPPADDPLRSVSFVFDAGPVGSRVPKSVPATIMAACLAPALAAWVRGDPHRRRLRPPQRGEALAACAPTLAAMLTRPSMPQPLFDASLQILRVAESSRRRAHPEASAFVGAHHFTPSADGPSEAATGLTEWMLKAAVNRPQQRR